MKNLPTTFPTKTPDRVSLDDKRALFEYGVANELSPAGLRKMSGVDDITLGVWRHEVTQSIRSGIEARKAPAVAPKKVKNPTSSVKKPGLHRSREEKIEVLEQLKNEGLTIAEAARRAGVSAPTIKAWRKSLGYDDPAPVNVDQPVASPALAADIATRTVVITRTDGTRVEVALTSAEVAAIIGLS